MNRAVLVLLLLIGCARVVPYSRAPLPCQDQAVDLVWRQVYGRADRPPGVWWVPPAAQNCGRTVNGARGFMTSGGCAGGASYGPTADVDLVWYGAWELTALAHEFAHVVEWRSGSPDPQHTGPMFAGGAVERANQVLAEADLCHPTRPSAMAWR